MLENSISIITDPSETLWKNCLKNLKLYCQTDHLFKNYKDLVPENFYYFSCAVYLDEIISFGAVQYSPEKWGYDIARVLTRFWIHPGYRSKGLTKWGDNQIRLSPLILKNQLDFLKKQNKIKVVMITREGNCRRSFKEISRLSSTVSDDSFDILEKKYNVCGDSEDDSCFQMISLSSISATNKWKIFNQARQQGKFKELL
jgi:hypothetical protein